MKNTTRDSSLSSRRLMVSLKRQKYILLMLAPAFILTFIFSYVPLFGWIIAFKEYRVGQSIFEGKFTGLLQFKRFFMDSSDFIYLIRNTLVMNVVSILQNIVMAVILAVLMKELTSKRFAKTVQTVTFFPYFISWVITYSIVWSLFAVQSGAINRFLVTMGLRDEGYNILGDPRYSWGLIIYLNLWKYTGYNCIIFLAAISGIPQEQYESAEIDGAGLFRKIWHITLPNLLPTACVLLIMNSGWVLNSNLEQFFIFTNPTNWETMEVLDMYIYKFGMKLLDYSYATAVGMMKTIVSLIILVGVNNLVKRLNESAIF
ncbi:MAG: sugar ABC transporter permease [Clostridiales bacterium]|nr:sugar ABC transporter permease [Clostridiales bacterium]